jgi:glycosyltransferase involved in cell wall biosynthesis
MKKTDIVASVIVSSYNHQKYIWNCLNSIKTKTNPNIEVIIIDDCSTDHSPKIIKTWEKANKNHFAEIKTIFHNQQCGISNVILELVNSARANILLPLASDDMYEAETVDERIRFLYDNPKIWVGFSDASAIDKSGKVITKSLHQWYQHQNDGDSPTTLKKELILNWNYPANIQFWRKGHWIQEISPAMFSEDVEIGLAALVENKIKYLNKILYQYRCAHWPIQTKGCEQSKRLHLSFYYRKAAFKSRGISKYALKCLSNYNLSLAVADKKQAKKDERILGLLKKIPSKLFK